MNKLSSVAVAAAAFGASLAAQADPYYASQAYAEVLSSTPVYREVRVDQPRQECYDQQVVYQEPRYNGNEVGGTLLGGLVGGVVGHAFGRGSGNLFATAAGAVVGASVGNNIGRRYDSPYGTQQVGYQQRCEVVHDTHYEQRPMGYDVTYRYGGQVYHTHLPYDPGSRMLVNVAVSPAPAY